MDHAGAVIGPLAAAVFLWAWPGHYRSLFLWTAAPGLLVGATAYRMLHGWPPNVVQPGDPVLVWGGAGGLGDARLDLRRLVAGAVLQSGHVPGESRSRSPDAARSGTPAALRRFCDERSFDLDWHEYADELGN